MYLCVLEYVGMRNSNTTLHCHSRYHMYQYHSLLNCDGANNPFSHKSYSIMKDTTN